MEIKGTAVKSVSEFVKVKFTTEYANWLKELPVESAKIITDVRSNNWYPIKEASTVPSMAVAKLFFDNNIEKGGRELGRYSAETALSGIYKIYVRFSTPAHIIARAERIISAYYSPSKLTIANRHDKSVQVIITQFELSSNIIEYRIAGWYEKALEISGCKNVEVNILKSIANGDTTTTFECKWN